MITGIILLLLGVFLTIVAGVGVKNYNPTDDNSTSVANTIIVFFAIGAFLLVNGGYRIDDYIWPPKNKTEAILEQ